MFEVTHLFLYKIVFIIELIIAEALFVFNLRRRSNFGLRLAATVAVCVAAACFFPLFGFNNAYYTSFVFFVLFCLTVGGIYFCFDEALITVLFCSIAAYSIQHLAFLAYTLLCTAVGVDLKTTQSIYLEVKEYSYNPISFGVYFVSYSLVYWAGWLIFARRINKKNQPVIDDGFVLFLSLVLVIIEILVNAVITYESYYDFNVTFIIAGKVAGVVCCLLALLLQFNLLTSRKLTDELTSVKKLWRQERRQYAISKSNIELINKKCHDLKYQIREIGEREVVEEGVIQELESAIKIYDSDVKTGNEALDIVIREKALHCATNGISFTCSLDGVSFSFMSDADIYALFGNAFDNAIEAVSKLASEYRVINVAGLRNGGMFSVSIRNYCVPNVTFKGGLPVSTKANDGYHGYGMRSIRDIVEKYGGDFAVTEKDGVFSLSFLFFDGRIQSRR